MANGFHDIANGNGYIYITENDGTTVISSLPNTDAGLRRALDIAGKVSITPFNKLARAIIDITAVTGAGTVTALTIDGNSQITSSIAYLGSNTKAEVAQLIRDEVNGTTPGAGVNYTAVAVGGKVYLFAPYSTGTAVNGDAISTTDSGGLTFTETEVHAGGSDDADLVTPSYSHAYRFLLDADYGGTATEGDIGNAIEISKYMINRSLSSSHRYENLTTLSEGILSIERDSTITVVHLDLFTGTTQFYGIDPADFVNGDIIIIGCVNGSKSIVFNNTMNLNIRNSITVGGLNANEGAGVSNYITFVFQDGVFYEKETFLNEQKNYVDVVPPTVNDDEGSGFIKFSRWIDSATGYTYTCIDPTAGAAVWVQNNGTVTAYPDPPLTDVLTAGNTTGGVDIEITSGDTINFNVGSGGVLNSESTTGSRTWNLPDASGVLALSSEIPSLVGLKGVLTIDSFSGGLDINLTSGDVLKFNVGDVGSLNSDTITAARTWLLPDKSGTIAMLSDVATPNLNQVLGNGNSTGGVDISVSSGDTIKFNNAAFTADIAEPTLVGNITLTLPASTGTFALLSDITSLTIGDTVNSGTSGSILFVDGGGLLDQNNANFYFDDSNIRFGLGTNTPDASSIMEISSTTAGFLGPRMTTIQRTGITTPAEGLMVYDTDLEEYYYRTSTIWQKFSQDEFTNGGEAGGANRSMGNTDNFDLSLLANNSPLVLLDASLGRVVVGDTANTVNEGYLEIVCSTNAGSFEGILMTNSSAPGSEEMFSITDDGIMYLGKESFLIDGNGSRGAANASSAMEISSTSRGFLMPRMTTAQFAAISTKATGLLAYDTDEDTFSWYDGSDVVWLRPRTEYVAGSAAPTITFDRDYSVGNSGSACTGNITASATGANVGSTVVLHHNDSTEPTVTGATELDGSTAYATSAANYYFFYYDGATITWRRGKNA